MSWREKSKCLGADTNIFFPVDADDEDDYSEEAVDEARSFCVQCTVVTHCLVWAVKHSPNDGVYGDTVPAERKSLTKKKSK